MLYDDTEMRKSFWMPIRWHVGGPKEAELDWLPEMKKRVNGRKV